MNSLLMRAEGNVSGWAFHQDYTREDAGVSTNWTWERKGGKKQNNENIRDRLALASLEDGNCGICKD